MSGVDRLVSQVDARRANQPVNHLCGLIEIVFVVRSRHGESDGKGSTSDAATGASSTLLIISGRRRHVAKKNSLQIAEVYAQLESR